MRIVAALITWALVSASAFGQDVTYAMMTDMHVGAGEADKDLQAAIADANKRDEIEFVVFKGDLTEKGLDEELDRFADILETLEKPFYVIPGNHDTKWSESAGLKLYELFGDDMFVFEQAGRLFVGINSGILWRGGGGHVTPETLARLDSVVRANPTKDLTLFVHHPLDFGIDNWYKVTNILRKGRPTAVFVGHGHANKPYDFNGIPGAMSRATLNKYDKGWGYNIVVDRPDSIFLYEVAADVDRELWLTIEKSDSLEIPFVDSADFAAYETAVVARVEPGKTLVAPPTPYEGDVIVATLDGDLARYRSTGEEVWRQSTPNWIVSRPVVRENVIAVGSATGDLTTYNASTGEPLQSVYVGEPITADLVAFPVEYYGEPSHAVVAGTGSGRVFCFEFFYLEELWRNEDAGGMIETEPLVTEDRIVFGAWDARLYCIDRATGMLNWKWVNKDNFYYSPAACPPVADEKNVYIATPDKIVSAVDMMLGSTRWQKEGYGCWESIGIDDEAGVLYVKSVEETLYALSAKNGKRARKFKTGHEVDTAPAKILVENGVAYVPMKSGLTYAAAAKTGALRKLLFAGTARQLSVVSLGGGTLVASTMDGTLVFFSTAK
jgi:outer membrane protein assembly factor BamB/predicted phosphodiesterase